jgi:hypothetical protein
LIVTSPWILIVAPLSINGFFCLYNNATDLSLLPPFIKLCHSNKIDSQGLTKAKDAKDKEPKISGV